MDRTHTFSAALSSHVKTMLAISTSDALSPSRPKPPLNARRSTGAGAVGMGRPGGLGGGAGGSGDGGGGWSQKGQPPQSRRLLTQ